MRKDRAQERPPRAATPLPGVWQAEVIELGRGRYRVRFTKGGLAWGPGDAPSAGFVKWGRERAMAFARRKITMLTLQDERERHMRRWVL